ncbi:MAG: phosphotriesterase family protein [Anaerolineae bacterium]
MACQTPNAATSKAFIQTVLGPIQPSEFGTCLPHEHIMVDFIGADKTSPERWQVDEVVARMEPHLQALVAQGAKSFVDCTPDYLGRDVEVLRQLSERTGLHILTNTGWYKAPHLPIRAFENSAEQIAAEWTAEWHNGIGQSGIKPGFIKIAVNPGKLEEVQVKIVAAAARTHLASGLVVACHTGEAVAAHESLEIIEAAGMNPARYIIVHADQIARFDDHVALFKRGAWLEYDALGTRPLASDVSLVKRALDAGFGDQIMLSQDAGWYNVGQKDGGQQRPFTGLLDEIIPALAQSGVDQATVKKLTVDNPARAFSVQLS